MIDFVVPIISTLLIGQVSLSVPLLLSRAKRAPHYYPLALFLLANGVLAISPMLNSLPPGWNKAYCAIAFPMLFVITPSLWLYVKGITANELQPFTRRHLKNYILLLPALVVSVMLLCLPTPVFNALFIYDTEVSAPLGIATALLMALLMLVWLIQCLYNLLRVFRQLATYRKKLNDYFSNHDNKQLTWINKVLFMGIVCWILSLTTLFSSHLLDNLLFNTRTQALMFLGLIWSLAHFGLQQKQVLLSSTPASTLPENPSESSDAPSSPSTPNKYQRSALGAEDSARIATKLVASMQQNKLYMDPDLSLQKLAKHLGISHHYISQTLNETLHINFFNFVNQWRIEAAKPLILANRDTVLDIALQVGFNARSSFYKAFKEQTGQTPSEFRKNAH